MPVDKKTSTTTTSETLSKRKATSAKKTKTTKTKITRSNVVTKAVESARKPTVERVQTERHRRMVERAKIRSTMADTPVELPEVEAVRLTDVSGVVYEGPEYLAMVEMYDSTIKNIKEGEIVDGTVLGVSRDDIIVDVGFKSEGIIPISEFTEPVNIKVGDAIEVYLEQMEDINGQLILSKQKADFMRVWDRIRGIHDCGDKVEGIVSRRIKGGLVVDIMGVDAFLPGSQVALRQVPDFDALIGQPMDLKIIKINKSRRNIVVSRRVVLEEERESMRSTLLAEIAVGQIRQGTVKNITDFGVFIDLGGVDGLLHITDMSWGRIRHPSEMVTLGEKIDVKILDYDDKTSRISLGLKQMTPYPWENIEGKYPLGRQVTGRVVSITDYGAFVELEKGIEGLIHISEMSWTQHIKHPSKIMNTNDKVEAIVLSVDQENEKISLGIKQLEPDPWATIEAKYPVGQTVAGKVRNLTAFGAFVELEEGIDGLVHISDMSWTRRIQHPSEIMKKGETVEIKIIRVDNENRRISLGFKQLTEDPWPQIAKKFAVGSEALGTITKVLDRGVVVDLDGEVEGFVPTAQLGLREIGDPASAFKEGEQLPLSVVEFDQKQRKIVLSVAAYYKKREKAELEEYRGNHPLTTSMADAIPDELKPTEAKAVEKPVSVSPDPEVDASKDEAAPSESPDEAATDSSTSEAEDATEDSSPTETQTDTSEDLSQPAQADSEDSPEDDKTE